MVQRKLGKIERIGVQMKICDLCGIRLDVNNAKSLCISDFNDNHSWVEATVHPKDQGKRTIRRSRHDLIPLEFLDEIASIFEEGLQKYGDSWKKGGRDFLIDCLNHASNHLHKYCNGDISENQLSKVAWNALVVRYFDLKGAGLNGFTRELEKSDGQGSTSDSNVERNVSGRSQSEREMVDGPRIGASAETQRPRNVVSDPQRDF